MAKPNRISLSGPSSTTIATIVRDSIGIDSSAQTISFRGSSGKGTGEQSVKPSQYPAVLSVLKDLYANGSEESDKNLSPAEMLRASFRQADEVDTETGERPVYFRLKGGQGAKPVKLRNMAALGEFILALESTMPSAMAWFAANQPDTDEGKAAIAFLNPPVIPQAPAEVVTGEGAGEGDSKKPRGRGKSA